MSNERPFTVKQLAERWTCSPSYIYKLIAQDELRAFHLGGTLKRIPWEEVRRWEQSGKSGPVTGLTASGDIGSDGSSKNSSSSGATADDDTAIDLASARKKKRERSLMRLRAPT